MKTAVIWLVQQSVRVCRAAQQRSWAANKRPDRLTSTWVRVVRTSTSWEADGLLNDARFRNDPEWKAFLERPEALGFAKLLLPDGKRALYVDKTLLGPADKLAASSSLGP